MSTTKDWMEGILQHHAKSAKDELAQDQKVTKELGTPVLVTHDHESEQEYGWWHMPYGVLRLTKRKSDGLYIWATRTWWTKKEIDVLIEVMAAPELAKP